MATLLIVSRKQEPELTANDIVNKSIEVSGGERFKKSTIDFDFRDKHYKAIRDNWKFQYEREFKDSTNTIKDVLTNSGFERFINNQLIETPDSMAVRYTASVNSVHYFSVLPFGLNDKAVYKTYLEKVEIKGKMYHKIKVTFNENGGGEDFEDIFLYWIDVKLFKVDYLAYSYNESNGKGLRFREAYNERFVNGIRFVDYNNFKPETNTVSLEELDAFFETEELKLLSKIELKNINVE
jgi:hypothetical protein